MADVFIEALKAGHCRFLARFSRRDTVDGTAPEWNDFPGGASGRVLDLQVTLRTTPLKGKLAKEHPVGEILSLYPADMPGWAEYSERSYCGNGEFLAEDYRMQLLEVVE